MNRVRSLLERNERIGHDDCRDLFEVKDITALARLARIPYERRFGRRSFYRNAHVAEYRGEHAGMFIAEQRTAAPEGVAELIVRCPWQGGEALGVWKERFASFASIDLGVSAAVSPGFIVRLAAFEGVRPAHVLEELAAALPLIVTAEEAELFDDNFRADHSPGVISVDEWAGVHRAAHRLGMKTVAGMTYSTLDHPAEYAHHLNAIRALQDETGGFAAFAPMALHNRGAGEFYLAAPTAAQTLRAVSIARAFLDNIQHIVVAPALVTLEVAVLALNYGADMVDTAIAQSDVHSEEQAAAIVTQLPVVASDALGADVLAAFAPVDAGLVASRIAEARFTAVPCNFAFAEAVAA